MNAETKDCNCGARCAYAFAVLCATLIVAALVVAMRHYSQPPAPNANRANERTKALTDLHTAEHAALTTPGWINQGHGVVRLKVEDAVNLVQQWRDPAVVRSNLIVRVDKANPAPPPPPA